MRQPVVPTAPTSSICHVDLEREKTDPSNYGQDSLITQIAVFSSDTSSPTNSFIPQSSLWLRYGNGASLPLTLQR